MRTTTSFTFKFGEYKDYQKKAINKFTKTPKIKEKILHKCIDCGVLVKRAAKRCIPCSDIHRSKLAYEYGKSRARK